jgi:arsenate reductase (thioredoxin)
MINILFVCTGNSCRSQIAEGFARYYSNGKFQIKSAGIFPTGIHPMAIQTMKEAGVDISEQTSDMLNPSMIEWCDYFITLCGSARDRCPTIKRKAKKFHWDIENPDILYSSDADRCREFARIRDEIKRRVEELFLQIEKGEI